MSIESVDRFDGPVTLYCDDCKTGLDFPSFKKAVAFKKAQKERKPGWRSSMVNGVWQDFCPKCVAKWASGASIKVEPPSGTGG